MDKNIVPLSYKVIAPRVHEVVDSHPTSLLFRALLKRFSLVQQCPQEDTPQLIENITELWAITGNPGVYTRLKIILNVMFA